MKKGVVKVQNQSPFGNHETLPTPSGNNGTPKHATSEVFRYSYKKSDK